MCRVQGLDNIEWSAPPRASAAWMPAVKTPQGGIVGSGRMLSRKPEDCGEPRGRAALQLQAAIILRAPQWALRAYDPRRR
jgi:hypothetical protein